MQTHDLGSLFVHTIKLKKSTKRVHRANTHELDFPYRISRSWVFRVWGEHGFVLGYWRKQQLNEHESILSALDGRHVGVLTAEGLLRDSFETAQEGTCEPRRDDRTPRPTWDTGTVSSGA